MDRSSVDTEERKFIPRLSTIKYRLDILLNATSPDETENEILIAPSRGHTSQLRKDHLVLTNSPKTCDTYSPNLSDTYTSHDAEGPKKK